jgi:hypothetical protein
VANERYTVIPVECPRCKIKQKIHVALRSAAAMERTEEIQCLNCKGRFNVTIPDTLIRGPFPA